MRKILLLMLTLAFLLAGCGEQQDNSLMYDRTGSYYNEYIGDDTQPGSYRADATAHIEGVLPLLYFDTDKAQEVGFYLEAQNCQGEASLVYVYSDAQGEHEQTVWQSGDGLLVNIDNQAGSKAANGEDTAWLALSAKETRLEWRSEKGADLQFSLELTGLEDVAVSENDWEALPVLPELALEPGQGYFTHDAAIMNAKAVSLGAAERSLLLECSPREAVEIELVAVLEIAAGDLQLVYTQAEGSEAVLWDSRAPEQGAELLEMWQLPEVISLENTEGIGEDALLLRLPVDLQPGAGWLEWQAGDQGAEYILSHLLWLNIAGARVTAIYSSGVSFSI